VEEASPHAPDLAFALATGLMGGEFASALVEAVARSGMARSADVSDAFDDDNSEH